MNPRIGVRHFFLAVATLAITSGAAAQPTGANRERASIVIGRFVTDRNTEARLDAETGLGTDIALESDLGLDTSTSVFRFGSDVWFGQRHRFDVTYFDFSRSAARRIDETIEFGGQEFTVDTVVTTRSDISIIKADYTFAALNRPKGYLGVTGGLYVGKTELSLSEPLSGTFESEDLLAPLPVIGARGEYEITDRVTIRGASQWFSIDAGDASGRLRDLYIGADYRLGRRFAVGLAYNDVTMTLRAEEDDGFTGRLDWDYDGWFAYFKTDFGRSVREAAGP